MSSPSPTNGAPDTPAGDLASGAPEGAPDAPSAEAPKGSPSGPPDGAFSRALSGAPHKTPSRALPGASDRTPSGAADGTPSGAPPVAPLPEGFVPSGEEEAGAPEGGPLQLQQPGEHSLMQQQQGPPPGVPLKAAAVDPQHVEVVRRVWIDVKRVYSLPLMGPAKGLLETSSISVVAVWLPESRNEVYFHRRTRKVTATNKCELQPQPFDVIANAIRIEEELLGQTRLDAQVNNNKAITNNNKQ